jgi:hypothetical protein
MFPEKVYANFVVVLDEPLKDLEDSSFERLLIEGIRENHFPLLENMLDEINEAQMFAVMLSVLRLYGSRYKKILVHVHQFPETSDDVINFLRKSIGKNIVHQGLRG